MRIRNVINGQIQFFKNNSGYAKEEEAVKVLIETRLKTIKGEIWTDTSIGIPYFDKISDKSEYDIYIQDIINNIDEVDRISSFESSVNQNIYHLDLTVISNNKEVEISI